jgi:probable HAF family extracellular repeat protein
MVGLGDLPGGGFEGYAEAVSTDGSVVVGMSSSAASGTSYEAFRWTQAGGMVGLGGLPGGMGHSTAHAVSADGSVVVGTARSANSGTCFGEAFRWTQAGGMVGLGDLPGGRFCSNAQAVSADGLVVFGSSVGAGLVDDSRAFRWTRGTGMVALDLLTGATGSNALDASRDGTIAVGIYLRSNAYFAAIWTPDGTMRDLREMLVNDLKYDLTGWELRRAYAISADGRWVTGSGTNPSGQDEAWVANIAPIPEPSSVALAGLGLAALAGYGWRRRREATGRSQ